MRKTQDEEIVNQLRREAAEHDRWSVFASSDFGKHFVAFLDMAMDETVTEEDKFNVYDKETHHILYHLAALRSKRQTLRAIKEKIIHAEEKKRELLKELNE